MFFGAEKVLIAGILCLGTVDAILSKRSERAEDKTGQVRNRDSQSSQSVHSPYRFEHVGYDHGGVGLSAHTTAALSQESFDGFHSFDSLKHHGYGHDDLLHHHHHHEHHDHHDHHGHHDHHHHKHHDHDAAIYHKALAIKGLLVPLAGVALLGAAAAFVSNPILLQLGVISGAALGRRRRRDTSERANDLSTNSENEINLNHIKVLERFMSQVPKQQVEDQEKRILADYLSCSGLGTNDLCLERLACELHSDQGTSMPVEVNVLSIVLEEILGNRFVPISAKNRILQAVARGREHDECDVYECAEFEKSIRGQKQRQQKPKQQQQQQH